MVLHGIGNAGLHGLAGSIPAVGVSFKDRFLNE